MTTESEVPEEVADAVTDAQKAEGEEAMRIAKLNHPNVDWQADPVTGAPLVPGLSQTETFETTTYNPPPPGDTTGQQPEDLDGQPAPEPQVKAQKVDKEEKGK